MYGDGCRIEKGGESVTHDLVELGFLCATVGSSTAHEGRCQKLIQKYHKRIPNGNAGTRTTTRKNLLTLGSVARMTIIQTYQNLLDASLERIKYDRSCD